MMHEHTAVGHIVIIGGAARERVTEVTPTQIRALGAWYWRADGRDVADIYGAVAKPDVMDDLGLDHVRWREPHEVTS